MIKREIVFIDIKLFTKRCLAVSISGRGSSAIVVVTNTFVCMHFA